MSLWARQNRADDQGAAYIPDMPGYQDWKDKPFARMVTEQDQIWWLYWHLIHLPDEDDYANLQKQIDAINERIDALEDRIKTLEGKVAKLEKLFFALAAQGMDYDVTKGLFTSSIAAQRRMWQAQNYLGMTVEDLATFTVAEAAQMEVRHVAVDGRAVYMHLGTAPAEMPWQDSYEEAWFNPDAYIRKDELTLIDTDNLADHNIMGVLTEDAASRLPAPVPYMRPGTAEDLKNLHILFNDHMVTVEE